MSRYLRAAKQHVLQGQTTATRRNGLSLAPMTVLISPLQSKQSLENASVGLVGFTRAQSTTASTLVGMDEGKLNVRINPSSRQALAVLGVKHFADLSVLSDAELQRAGLSLVDSRKLIEAAKLSSSSLTPSKDEEGTPVLSMGQATLVDLNETGLKRGDRSTKQILVSSVLAGSLLSWGATLYVLLAGGSADVLSSAPGLHKVMAAAVFPMGLTAITLSGSDLLTSNMLYGSLPLISGDPRRSTKEKIASMAKLWSVSLSGNFVSSVAMAALVAPLVIATPQVAAFAKALAIKKTTGTFMVAFSKGVAANWLVNVATFQAATAKTSPGKMAALWMPVTAFVALGLEHSVANMFLVPLGALCGADISATAFFVDNLVPVLAGNAVGAVGGVGWLYWHGLMPSNYLAELHKVKK